MELAFTTPIKKGKSVKAILKVLDTRVQEVMKIQRGEPMTEDIELHFWPIYFIK